MIEWVENDTDEELARNFIESPFPGKQWRIWGNVGENPIEPEIEKALQQKFPGVPRIATGVSLLWLFERNALSKTVVGEISLSQISLPALELRFRDPDNHNAFIVGFIEGKKNINNFLRSFVQKYDEKYSYTNIGKRLVWFEFQLSERHALTDEEKSELKNLLKSLLRAEDDETKELYSRLRTVHDRSLIAGNLSRFEILENEFEDLCAEYASPEITKERKKEIRERLNELEDLLETSRLK
jgi:hypothetical protein